VRDPVEYAWARVAEAHRLWHAQEREKALDVLLRCGRELDAMGVRNPVLVTWWTDAVAWLAELGRTGDARELAGQMAEAARRWGTAAARGCALLAEGLVTRDPATLERAASELDTAERRLIQVQALTAWGRALLAGGDDKAARKALRDAVALAMRCGDVVAAGAARTALRNAGGRMSESSGSSLGTLTGGEHRVALMAAQGHTNREIAAALFVTVRTVESHLSNVYRKLGIRTRAELAVRVESVAS
jgi:DNA-binding CsgD family transcriptional regulator